MSDEPQDTKPTEEQTTDVVEKRAIPPQESPTDISNWVDRPLTTPGGRIVIETDQTTDGEIIAE